MGRAVSLLILRSYFISEFYTSFLFDEKSPKVVEDPSIPVSYLDVYETLADLIGTKTACNEAPDSRSLMTLLEGTEPSTKLKYSKIFTHAKKVQPSPPVRGQGAPHWLKVT